MNSHLSFNQLIKFITAAILSSIALIAQGHNDSLTSKSKLKDASIHLGAIYTQAVSEYFIGGNYNLNFYLTSKYALGLSMTHSTKKISQNFGFLIEEPIIYYYEFGIINHYDFFNTDKLKVGVNLNNGVVISELGDEAKQVDYLTSGGKYKKRALEVSKNTFYLLEPGIDALWLIYKIPTLGGVYLNPKIKYRMVLGKANHAETKDFSGVYFGLGLTLTDMED